MDVLRTQTFDVVAPETAQELAALVPPAGSPAVLSNTGVRGAHRTRERHLSTLLQR